MCSLRKTRVCLEMNENKNTPTGVPAASPSQLSEEVMAAKPANRKKTSMGISMPVCGDPQTLPSKEGLT